MGVCCGGKTLDARLNYPVKAKFVGWRDGQLIRQAPGGIPQGAIWTISYQEATAYPWWEPLEHPPDLEVPDMDEDDSVYDGVLILEDEDEAAEDKVTLDPRLAEVIAEDTDIRGLEDHIIDASPPYIPVGRGGMSKEDLVKRIKEKGGQANMSMRKTELEDALEDLNSSPQ